MTTGNVVPLSFSADQLLTGLAADLAPGAGTTEWLEALLARQPFAVAEAGFDPAQLETAVHDRLARGEKGEPLRRDDVAARAGLHAAEKGRDVAASDDLAFVLLEDAQELFAAPAPEPEPVEAPAAVPLSFAAEQLLTALFHGAGSAPLGDLLTTLIRDHHDAVGAAQSGLDLAALEASAGEARDLEPLASHELAARAGERAASLGRDVAGRGDIAYAVLDAGRGLEPARAEEPEPEPTVAPTAPVGRPRTFRLFVSSTFKDLEEERNVLRERVYPALREYCRARGARFQDVDLRWGVSEEASLDQQAMNICLGEIERCREVTPRPNFLVLLGNRYGWLALPPQILAAELELLLEHVHGEDAELVHTWYQLDENAVPPEYRLRPRTGEWEQASRWDETEAELRRIFTGAVAQAGLDEERRAPYETSATEQEIAAGALELGAPEGRASCFVRELELGSGDPDPAQAADDDPVRTFADPEQTRLEALKKRLVPLPGKRYRATWDAERGAPSRAHLDELAADVEAVLVEAIERELADPSEPPGVDRREPRIQPDEQLDAEGRAHREFADERLRFFVGRDDVLDEIQQYLEGFDPHPFVLHGGGGTGKSALLAEAIRRAQTRCGRTLVYRFIGATPGSADGRGLLQGICRELLARGYGAETEVPAAYEELSADFRRRLESADATHPLTLFVDSLDQLASGQGARGLDWIPSPLPEHVRLVVSTRPGETLDPLRGREARLVELGPMPRTDGDRLLTLWLDDTHRALRTEQRDAVLDAFAASQGNPLYLRLAFEEARRWTSDQAPEELAEGIEGIIERNTFARLAHEENHGEVLLSHALGYLAASRHGLGEDELLDLLSADPDVYRWFVLGSYHVPLDLRERLGAQMPGADVDEWVRQIRDGERPAGELDEFLAEALPRRELRLPVVLWSRLHADLRPYLVEQAFEDAVLIGFYHRELGDVARARYVRAGVDYHARLARYFRPDTGDDERRDWSTASPHALSELPYHLTQAEGLEDELYETLTDFRFLEEKAARVGVVEGSGETVYTGVFRLQDDFDLALEKLGGGARDERRPLIVTAVDVGEGLAVSCPWCRASNPFQQAWLGREIPCPRCDGPLKVNPFVAKAPR